MPKKEGRLNSTTVQPSETDDLKLIIGIGPAVEKRLHGVGIFTFAQLAALSSADIAAAVAGLNGLSAERIIRQDWIGQARKLATEPAASDANLAPRLQLKSVKDTDPSMVHPQVATFTINVLLDEHNNVSSTYALHTQSKHEHTWTGWSNTQLLDFIIESAGLNIPSDETDLMFEKNTEREPPISLTSKLRLTSTKRVLDIELIGVEYSGPRRIIAHGEPFSIHLTLDLSKLQRPDKTLLNYKIIIYGKSRGKPGLVIGEAQGTIISHDRATIMIEAIILSTKAIYQLTATVFLGLPGMKLVARTGTTAIVDGGLLEVY